MKDAELYIEDPELGRIMLRGNRRSKRFVFRCQEDAFVCTFPVGARKSDLLRAIEELRPRLKSMLQRTEERRAHQRHVSPEEIERYRQQAKLLLPPRLHALAAARGLCYQKVSIRKSVSRWGSCSSKGNISLSLFLMMLPFHLQDYVMQHELTHLLEMNHGPRFWALLNEATGDKALQYRKEIRKFSNSICLQS